MRLRLLLSVFASKVFAVGPFTAFLSFFIVCIVDIVLCAVFLRDYPEQCGAHRDNDSSITPAIAKAMMEAEIKAKETSVWTLRNTLKCRDFWFLVLPESFMLLSAVGMNQSVPVLACFGSWLLGVLDTRFGTKTAILISCIIMLVGGICGAIRNLGCVLVAAGCLAF